MRQDSGYERSVLRGQTAVVENVWLGRITLTSGEASLWEGRGWVEG